MTAARAAATRAARQQPQWADASDADLRQGWARLGHRGAGPPTGDTRDDTTDDTTDEATARALAIVREAIGRGLGVHPTVEELSWGAAVRAGAVLEAAGIGAEPARARCLLVAAFLAAAEQPGVHVMSAEPADAGDRFRQAVPVADRLGLRVGLLAESTTGSAPGDAYRAAVTFGTVHQFGYDYLREHLATGPDPTPISRSVALLPDTDGVLLDLGRVPLLIDGTVSNADEYRWASASAASLHAGVDYELRPDAATVTWTAPGRSRLAGLLGPGDPHPLGTLRKRRLVEATLIAGDVDRPPVTAGVGEGTVQRILQARAGVAISPEVMTLARITVRAFCATYSRLGGLCAELVDAGQELREAFGLHVISKRSHGMRAATKRSHAKRAAALRAALRPIEDVETAHRDLFLAERNMIRTATGFDTVASVTLDPAAAWQVEHQRDESEQLRALARIAPPHLEVTGLRPLSAPERLQLLRRVVREAYARRTSADSPADLDEQDRSTVLAVLDLRWRRHLANLDAVYASVRADRTITDHVGIYVEAAAAALSAFRTDVAADVARYLLGTEAP